MFFLPISSPDPVLRLPALPTGSLTSTNRPDDLFPQVGATILGVTPPRSGLGEMFLPSPAASRLALLMRGQLRPARPFRGLRAATGNRVTGPRGRERSRRPGDAGPALTGVARERGRSDRR
ncbi:hypothetical protein GCM10027187_24880 [Streptosporangium sandarakinum]